MKPGADAMAPPTEERCTAEELTAGYQKVIDFAGAVCDREASDHMMEEYDSGDQCGRLETSLQ